MSRFFIDRPIFAWVIAIVIMLAGALAINNLPIAQYPTIAPPSVQISTSYPGASAKTVEDSVTQVLEQNMTGLDNLLYMSSQSDSSGDVSISLNFMASTKQSSASTKFIAADGPKSGCEGRKILIIVPDGRRFDF